MTVRASQPAINLREKLSELKQPTGVAGAAMLAADTVAEQQALLGVGRRNLIINGGFDVWQRGTSSTISTDNTYAAVDRWQSSFYTSAWGGGSRTVSRQVFTPGNKPNTSHYFCQFAPADAASSVYCYVHQRIEDVTLFDGVYVTVSFWARISTGRVTTNAYLKQSFGSGGSSDVDTAFPQAYTLDTLWRKFTLTLNAPSLAGKTIGDSSSAALYLLYATNLNGATLQLSQVQLELGKVATPFEHRSYGEELALCQRYYYRVSTDGTNASMAVGFVTSASNARGTITFPVTMRTAPTGIEHTGAASNYKVAYAAISATCSSVPTFANASNTMCGVNFGVASGLTVGHGVVIERNSGTAYIGFTGAEL